MRDLTITAGNWNRMLLGSMIPSLLLACDTIPTPKNVCKQSLCLHFAGAIENFDNPAVNYAKC
jgi:hypothetical protein